jgi:signal transduction histidine kinase
LVHFAVAARRFGAQPDQALKMLNETIEQARRAIREGREAVQGLRSSTEEPNDLVQAISRLAEELSRSRPSSEPSAGSAPQAIDIRVQAVGESRRLHPIIRDEIYRIAAEALRNALQHSQATQIEVELSYDVREFRLQVRDDGEGIDPQLLASEGRAGHFGLRGMRERAELAGGKLTVWSAPGTGTELEAAIPASRAYAAPRTRGRTESMES